MGMHQEARSFLSCCNERDKVPNEHIKVFQEHFGNRHAFSVAVEDASAVWW
jgi:hypothetical protein